MCGQWGEVGVTKIQGTGYLTQELTRAELAKIIDDAASFKPNITLFGGEPLLHPGCLDTIGRIKQKGMHCVMITNGSLVSEVAAELVRHGLDELNVSLDGDAALHDEIRGVPGLFERITSGLKRIREEKTKQNRTRPLVNVQCTITQYNYIHLEKLIAVAAEINADSLTFHNLIFLDNESLTRQREFDRLFGCSSLDWEGFDFAANIDPELLYKKMCQIRSQKHPFAIDFYPNFNHEELAAYYTKPGRELSASCRRCLSPWIVAYIFPDGSLRPCLNSSYAFGNVKHESFASAWNSREALVFRQALKKAAAFPACARCTELYRY
jgi:radical SAM protein with 4Fe4S-binding SPASM domain